MDSHALYLGYPRARTVLSNSLAGPDSSTHQCIAVRTIVLCQLYTDLCSHPSRLLLADRLLSLSPSIYTTLFSTTLAVICFTPDLPPLMSFFFLNNPAPPEIYPFPLHAAFPL